MVLKSKTRHYEENVNYGASPEIILRAKSLRKIMTNAEKLLWTALKDKQLDGFKFRRQHPIWIFVADFYCHQAKLIVELDGAIHQQTKAKDLNRTAELEKFGIKVLRFTNEEVLENSNQVLIQIKDECKTRSKTPSPTLPLEGKGEPTHKPLLQIVSKQ
jgi:very-short-patch-repair endonuclease